jgi:NAD(P)-dependent dehydrogenase (short-subunit alcohol dehydrogenase family)
LRIQLRGKTAIVTGRHAVWPKGATGFVKADASELIVDREIALGQATAAELSAYGTVLFMPLVLMDRAALPGVLEETARRIGDYETDIGAAVVFLASEAASDITGQTLMVDRGQVKSF